MQIVGLLPSPGHVQRAPGGGMDFEVDDGLGWLSRSHVLNAADPGAAPTWSGWAPSRSRTSASRAIASDEEPSGDDCTSAPDEVTELIEAEGTA